MNGPLLFRSVPVFLMCHPTLPRYWMLTQAALSAGVPARQSQARLTAAPRPACTVIQKFRVRLNTKRMELHQV